MGFLVRAGAGPCLVRFPLAILQYSPNVSQYSPGARDNNYVSLALPRGFLVPLSLRCGMAYLGELI